MAKHKKSAEDNRKNEKRKQAMKVACNKLGYETINSVVIARMILRNEGKQLDNTRQHYVDQIISEYSGIRITGVADRGSFAKPKKTKKRINFKRPVKVTKRTKRKKRSNETFYESREWRELRYEALKLHGRQCLCCGQKAPNVELHVDHIRPRSKFPSLELDINNLQILCKDCNLGKSNKDCIDYRIK